MPNKIYEFMKQNGLTTKDEATFLKEYSTPEKSRELHSFMVQNKLTTKDESSFYDEYFSPKGAQSVQAAGTGQDSNAPQTPSSLSGADLEAQRAAVGTHFDKLKERGIVNEPTGERKLSFVAPEDIDNIPYSTRKNMSEKARSQFGEIPMLEEAPIAGEKTGELPATLKRNKRNKEYNEVKAVADDFEKYGTKNYEAVDIFAAQKDFDDAYSRFEKDGSNADEVKEKEAKLNESLSTLDKDYLNRLLNKGQKGQWVELASKYDAISEKISKGEELTDAEKEFMYDTRKNALSAVYSTERAKVMEFEDNIDLKSFASRMATIGAEMKGLDANSPDYEAKAKDVMLRAQGAMAITGANEGVLDELDGAYKKLALTANAMKATDAKNQDIVYEEGVNEARKEQRKDKEWAITSAAKGLVYSMGTMALKGVGQFPKTIGIGDPNKYDPTDMWFDSVESTIKGAEGTWGKLEGVPDYMKYAYSLGEGVGSVAMFAAGGGASKLAGIPSTVGVMGTAFLLSQPDNYAAAIEAGMDVKDARLFANVLSTIEGAAEGIIPDSKYFGSELKRTVISEFKKGKNIREAIKYGMKQVPESVAEGLASGTKEGLEEITQQFAGDITKESLDYAAGRDFFKDTFDPEAYKESFLTGAMTGGFMRVFQSAKPNSPETIGAMRDAVDSRETIVKNIERVNPDLAKEVDEVLSKAEDAKTSIEAHSKWDKLTTEAQNKALDIVWRMEQAAEKDKEVSRFGIEDTFYKEEGQKLTAELASIFDDEANLKSEKSNTSEVLEEIKKGEDGIVEPKESETPVTTPEINEEEIMLTAKPVTDEMAALKMDIQNLGYTVDKDYDEGVIYDKDGEMVDIEDLPDNVKPLVERWAELYGEVDKYAGEMTADKAVAKSEKDYMGEEAEFEEVKNELPAAETEAISQTSPVQETEAGVKGEQVLKEGFTEGKYLNAIYGNTKAKYGDKKGSQYYDAATRLVNPNENTIVEVRSNGVVVFENGKYLLKPFTNTDANYKKWELTSRPLDVTDQFVSKEQEKIDTKTEQVDQTDTSTEAFEEKATKQATPNAKKFVDLYYKIQDAQTKAEKREAARERREFLEANPRLKFIDDNIKKINETLEKKGLLTKSKGCP